MTEVYWRDRCWRTLLRKAQQKTAVGKLQRKVPQMPRARRHIAMEIISGFEQAIDDESRLVALLKQFQLFGVTLLLE